eukprot:COSAG06_NODE_2701_length_6425_cov_64.649067_4_plen_38_part_00
MSSASPQSRDGFYSALIGTAHSPAPTTHDSPHLHDAL